MKKILITLALAVGFTSLVNAQYFVTSFGVELGWNIPNRVQTVVYNDYYGYDIVHATRVTNYGIGYFELILQRGDVFVEVTVRNDGWVNRRVVRYNYPLTNHVCGSVCGYHSNYYTTYYNTCNSHNHYGHNHVTYVKNRRPHHVHGNHPGNGNKHGHYKGNRNSNDRKSSGVTYTRRDRYQDNDRHDDHGGRVSRTSNEKSRRSSTPSRSSSSGKSRVR